MFDSVRTLVQKYVPEDCWFQPCDGRLLLEARILDQMIGCVYIRLYITAQKCAVAIDSIDPMYEECESEELLSLLRTLSTYPLEWCYPSEDTQNWGHGVEASLDLLTCQHN